MARRRKAELQQPPAKEKPQQSTVVRKSTRQRARKELEEQKVNGDSTSSNTNSKDSQDDSSQESVKKVHAVPKKSTRYKTLADEDKSSSVDSGNNGQSDVYETELELSDLHDVDARESLRSAVESQQSDGHNVLDQVMQDWSDDIIEETIICEEMEVEAEVADGCLAVQDDNVTLEQVFCNNFDGNVEYTVIQSEVGAESVEVPSTSEQMIVADDSCTNSNSYQIIEKGLSVLQVSDLETAKSSSEPEKSAVVENHKSDDASCDSIHSDNLEVNMNNSKKESRTLRSVSRSSKSTRTNKVIEPVDGQVKKESDSRRRRTETSTKKSASVENKVLNQVSREKSTRTKNLAVTKSPNVIEQDDQNSQKAVSQSSESVAQDDSSSSLPDKMDVQEPFNTPNVHPLIKDKVVNNSVILDKKCIPSVDTEQELLSRLPAKVRTIIFGEEHSQDSELEVKTDSGDAKVSSSSENSSDTLLSSNSCRVSDSNTDVKSTINQSIETDKKPEFRSRSGSTDTTGSESGSNSSGVRRSSRIKSIGLMKPRSRGRGLVSKPPVDIAKSVIQQERDQTTNQLPIPEKNSFQAKDPAESITEKTSEEKISNKAITAQDIPMPSTSTTGTAGYDSDSNKPVKVKSRWRRSSELEMSNFGSWTASQPNLGLPNPAAIGAPVGIVANLVNDPLTKLPPLPVGLSQESRSTNAQDSVVTGSSQSSTADSCGSSTIVDTSSNNTSTVISQTVGARISLPMVPKVEDREMEERLSQFEHLRENLYLTERYTSKETKRMVCDCFLTPEEIERGELGCGEDCLNRLLMIECGSRCVVGSRCTNKRFQNSEYATCEVFRTEKKGFGLRAVVDLYPDDFIMEYVGEVLDSRAFRKRAKEYSKDKNRHYYFMALKSDQIIDATMKGNISRFINHSCDPNAETQKWTVNGELRIGFFSRKFVQAGDEITFDYHFQRYGKEAQKCFCEAENCRGWIGDNPDDSKVQVEAVEEFEESEEESEPEVEDKEEKDDKEEKPKKRVRRKRVAKKVPDHMEDEDLEEQIERLCVTGLKNRSHTLTLSRLMVRSREMQHRIRLLKTIQSGEQPCRRLFLDYHGLRLIWSYMMDVSGSTSDEAQEFRLEVLKTLATLPIPNRTMLIDSKVLSLVEKWSKQLYHSPSRDSPEDDQLKMKTSGDDVEMDSLEKNDVASTSEGGEIKKEPEPEVKSEIKPEVDPAQISELAANLLVSWSSLKEVFRIPKKERIEQMKEHEREADRGYKEDSERDGRDSSSHDRHRSDRYSRSEIDKRSERRRGRDSPDSDYSRSKDKRVSDERPDLVQVPRMSKFERRQLFALKVAKEEEERLRRQQEDSWQQHEAQCLALGLDPYTTAAYDAQTGYPLFFNHQLGQWQPYPIQAEGTPASIGEQQCTPVYMGTPVSGPGQVLVVPPDAYPAGYVAATTLQAANGTPVYSTTTPPASTESDVPVSATSGPPPPLDLPPRWKWARDKRGRTYYYHVKERVSQWLPPPPDHIAVQPDSSDTSESSGDESSASEPGDEDDAGEQQQQLAEARQPGEPACESMDVDGAEALVAAATNEPAPAAAPPETTKKRRDGLVQERIISPRREEDMIDHRKYKEIKEKLRRQKERAKLKEQLEKMRKHRRGSKSKSHAKHSTSKFQPVVSSDMSPSQERRIKDAFRINMANVMVHFLNPYRKNDCKQGRITNTEDFKHLARKLTHFVLAKELKHCKSVDELECNDNVKHKAKDFVRKYMSKFGAVYQKGTDED